jgi:hypothetical protein
MLVELGVPLVLIATLFVAPRLRPFSYSVLGAVTPFLFAYVSVFTATAGSLNSVDKGLVEAIWVMSFFAYLVALVVGVALGLTARPKHSTMRFATASIVSIGVVWLVLLFS